ncbi:MAG: TlpA family protein disulfide reductase [Planctomycetaceae bacterium]|jgi:hypothetical protein|nr:TlpA family protein disulfide reductase [Phycisphaerales bacterium]MCE2652742.1 TlpA family protein disulfide reductase [Planctomycetaceae bacterium]
MNRIVCMSVVAPAALVFVLSGTAVGQVDEAAKAMLVDSAKAISGLQGLTFTGKRTTEGVGGMKLGGEARVTFLRSESQLSPGGGGSPATMALHAKGKAELAGEPETTFEASIYKGQAMWADAEKKTVFQRPFAPNNDGNKHLGRVRQIILPAPLLDSEPFAKEIRARKITMGEAKEIRGEACNVIVVEVEPEKVFHTIAISVADNLPRMYEISRVIGGANSRVVLRWEMFDLSTDAIKPEALTVPTPDGWKFDKQEAAVPTITPAATAPSAPAGGLPAGTAAPALDLKLAGGGKLTGEEIKGSVAVLGFWSPMVKASADMGKSLQAVAEQNKDVKVFAIAARDDGDEPLAQKWIADNKLSIRSAVGGDATAEAFNVRGFPSVVVLNKDGKVAAFFEAAPTAEALKAAVEAAGK